MPSCTKSTSMYRLTCTCRGVRPGPVLIEGVMAIQRIIDPDFFPYDGDGRRLPLEIARTRPMYGQSAHRCVVRAWLSGIRRRSSMSEMANAGEQEVIHAPRRSLRVLILLSPGLHDARDAGVGEVRARRRASRRQRCGRR